MCDDSNIINDDIFTDIDRQEILEDGLCYFQDQLKTADLKVKVTGVNKGGNLSIVGIAQLTNSYCVDDTYYMEAEGIFILTTDDHNYEIPIGVSGTYINHQAYATLSNELDSPVDELSPAQTSIVHSTLFTCFNCEILAQTGNKIKGFNTTR